jgi:hypothetical protein
MKLYKYLPPNALTRVFSRNGYVGLKCDLPKNYNDPFELFLSVNASDSEVDDLAYYLEICGQIPQMPTTCFSKRPDVVPMWAHYGRDHGGFVLEIDETALAAGVSRAYIDDIGYSETTRTVDLGLVHYAATTLKFRHTHRVQTMAFRNAYFTKSECWAYEMERRLVVNPSDIAEIDGSSVLFLPIQCVSGMISGAKARRRERRAQRRIARKLEFSYFRMKIGRASTTPYFVDDDDRTFTFGTSIEAAESVCYSCSEPISDEEKSTCNWCSVDDEARNNAALRNPLTMLYQLGLGSEYGFGFADLPQIGRETKARPPESGG